MSNLSVFIVEDDPMVLEVNKGFLNKLNGFQLVGESVNGRDAYKKIKNKKPNLILLDMFLPDMTGMELFLKLRADRIPSDIIMITAAKDAPTVQEALRLGAIDYLIKPFRFERFEKALQQYKNSTKKLPNSEAFRQEDIDKWLGIQHESTELPKGLNTITMQQILTYLTAHQASITSEQLAQNVGMARVTVRKYLDFLATKGTVKIELQYGTVGRPTKYYSIK
ncbi:MULTISPECIES: response regulator [unclassified Lysinibacillus]|uniref:response regulator n=1 Tax=unclassified Lysinibacillus TaxID=2636778 RepID=UPI0020132E79|nr:MULTISPECIES: response regulator [unclassified Lysinibacillus]MCL1695320.1 response regulator [Lysinibacillus sp. BPa_S21]MCL1701000.1 response regulator [Lysinibacillus sp. Bpr_S20]